MHEGGEVLQPQCGAIGSQSGEPLPLGEACAYDLEYLPEGRGHQHESNGTQHPEQQPRPG